MSCFSSSSSLLVFPSASTASTSISVTLSGSLILDADAFCVGSRDCFSDEILEEADEGTWGRVSV